MVEDIYNKIEVFFPFNYPLGGGGQRRGEEERKTRPIKSFSSLMPGFDSSSLLIPSAGMDAKGKSKSNACLGSATGFCTTGPAP